MRFYFENNMGDSGYFEEDNLIKGIYTSWNIEADLYLLINNTKTIDFTKRFSNQAKLIFLPMEDNEFNSKLLKEFGYYMRDGKKRREIVNIKTGQVVRYDWSEVMQLV